MSKLKIFISSTYYDLRIVRDELEGFINGLGYESIRHEQGHIPYGSKKGLEDYCYKEIGVCDILISIIGGRYGSKSRTDDRHSISQMELKTASELNKQVYIFIEKSVYEEHSFYLANRENKDVKYTHVDNVKIHEFIKTVSELPFNNTTFPFETASDIKKYLKDQLSGLFQRLLKEEERSEEYNLIKRISEAANKLEITENAYHSSLIKMQEKYNRALSRYEVLTSLLRRFDESIKSSNVGDYLISELQTALNISYAIVVYSKEQLGHALELFGYAEIIDGNKNAYYEWRKTENTKYESFIRISKEAFEADGSLICSENAEIAKEWFVFGTELVEY